nr:LysM peptidoglycan-binding domain-containing protein [Thaumasiovibrio subtropicus]
MITYTVKRGDYLGKIAEQHGVSSQSIRVQNNLKSDKLLVGQKLKIAVAVSQPIAHTVQRGDFLSKIASQYGVSVKSIRDANSLSSDRITIGQVLQIPSS